MSQDSEQERWRILMEKLERLADVDPAKARLIEAVIDELLEGTRTQPQAAWPKLPPGRKGGGGKANH